MAAQAGGRPNLLLVVADEYRGDVLGHVGNDAASTPRLDALAASDAVSFSHAFAQNTVCVPSRVSLMTGWYPHVRGHRTQSHLLHAEEPNLLRRLKDAGYHVWWSGKNDMLGEDALAASYSERYVPEANPMASRPDVHSWSRWWPTIGPGGYYSHYVGELRGAHEDDVDRRRVEGAAAFLRDAPPEPFAVVLTLDTPHCPYAVPQPWFGLTGRDRVPAPVPVPEAGDGKPAMHAALRRAQGLQGWTSEQWRELRATYYGMCARTDALVGEVVDALEAAGLYDRTAIVFTADHGDFAGDYGLPEKAQNLFEDALVRVPLVIKAPRPADGEPGHGVCDALVELVDLTATVESLCGLDPDYWHFGRSLERCLANPSTRHRRTVLSEGGRLAGEPAAMELQARQDPAGLYYPRMSVQREDEVAHGKGVMLRTRTSKYVHRLYEPDELYDLILDPQERTNRVDDPACADMLARLRSALLDRMLETADVVPFAQDPR